MPYVRSKGYPQLKFKMNYLNDATQAKGTAMPNSKKKTPLWLTTPLQIIIGDLTDW